MSHQAEQIDAGEYGSAANHSESLVGNFVQPHLNGIGYDFPYVHQGSDLNGGFMILQDNRISPSKGNVVFIDHNGNIDEGSVVRFNVVERLPLLP